MQWNIVKTVNIPLLLKILFITIQTKTNKAMKNTIMLTGITSYKMRCSRIYSIISKNRIEESKGKIALFSSMRKNRVGGYWNEFRKEY